MNSLAAAMVLILGAPAAAAPAPAAGKSLEIVIKGQDGESTSIAKPPCDLPFDPYETVRQSLEPDESLLLAQSPDVASWNGDSPVVLRSNHLLRPWTDGQIEQSDALRLRVKPEFESWKGRSLRPEDLSSASWTLSIVDENGQIFHRFKGAGMPPDTQPWDGRSDSGKWLSPGHDYSAIYVFSRAGTNPYTGLGEPLRLPALVHGGDKGLVISLDSSTLFGPKRDQAKIVAPAGDGLLRAAADYIRLKAYRSAVKIRLYGPDQGLASRQVKEVEQALASELFLAPGQASAEALLSTPAEARLDLLVDAR